jgi:chemotaxis protein methyltransferase WspC
MLTEQVALSLQHATGLSLALATVERAIRQRMKQCAISRTDAYLARVNQDGDELSALIELVVVPETWLFRDPEAFRAAVEFAQNRLAAGHGPVSFLSVPCATGEEPYSLAMALRDAGIAPSDFKIEAIDISDLALKRARRGEYGRYAFRSRDLSFRDRHFKRTEHGYELDRRIGDLVKFSQANLLKLDIDTLARRYDVIFCRNLLIYFDAPTQAAAIHTLSALLQDDGMLFVGYSEIAAFHRHGFFSSKHAMAFGLKKSADTAIARETGAAVRRPRPIANIRPAAAAPAAIPRPPRTVALPPSITHAELAPAAALEQASKLANEGDVHAASSLLDDYLLRVPDCAQAYLLQALICERKGDVQTAESHLRRAVYLNPQHYEALCHLALLTEQQGHRAAAATVRQRAARVFQRQSAHSGGKEHRGGK